MKKHVFTAAPLLGAALLLTVVFGCSAPLTPWGIIRRNVENSRNLRVGMTKGEVLEIMGEPIRDESFCKPDLWYYYIEMVWGDGLVTEEECMPLVFEGGKLVGWGNDFYIDYRLKRKEGAPVLNPEHEPADKDKAAPADKSAPAASADKKDKPAQSAPADKKDKPAPSDKPAQSDKAAPGK